jgi:hypothetical protein
MKKLRIVESCVGGRGNEVGEVSVSYKEVVDFKSWLIEFYNDGLGDKQLSVDVSDEELVSEVEDCFDSYLDSSVCLESECLFLDDVEFVSTFEIVE